MNTENAEMNEGTTFFDIIFYVRMKNGRSKIIINVEVQRKEPDKYRIINRAIFYVGRMISSQKEREFTGMNYDDIEPVYSYLDMYEYAGKQHVSYSSGTGRSY